MTSPRQIRWARALVAGVAALAFAALATPAMAKKCKFTFKIDNTTDYEIDIKAIRTTRINYTGSSTSWEKYDRFVAAKKLNGEFTLSKGMNTVTANTKTSWSCYRKRFLILGVFCPKGTKGYESNKNKRRPVPLFSEHKRFTDDKKAKEITVDMSEQWVIDDHLDTYCACTQKQRKVFRYGCKENL